MGKKNDFSGSIGGKGYNLIKEACPHYDEFQQRIASTLDNYLLSKTNAKILELGIGTGETTRALLEMIPPIEIIAIDKEERMIEEARRNLAGFEDRLTIIHAEAFEYLSDVLSGGWPRETFEGVVSGWTIHNIPRKKRANLLKKIYGVLSCGGVFVNGDKYYSADKTKRERAYHCMVKRIIKVGKEHNLPDWTREWIEHMKYDESPNIIMGEKESLDQLREIGFKDVLRVYRREMDAILVGRIR